MTRKKPSLRFIRNFPENGVKLLLEDPANVRELLLLVARDVAELIDFDRMTVEPGTC